MSDGPALVETLALVECTASADSMLRLLNETRTGKKLIARAFYIQLKAIQHVRKRVTMRTNTSRILLVGKCLIGSTELRSFLERLGARLHFSETLAGAASLLRRRRFDVVLSQAQLPEGSAHRLLRNLLTSPGSFILSFRAESTYLWLPAIWNGQHCWGTLALRPSEFRAKLPELLAEPHPPDSAAWRAPAENANQNAVISSSATTRRCVSVSCPRKQEEQCHPIK